MNQEKNFCKNCGAEINKFDAKCPFCGHINYIGAEAAYMDELYNTEDEMAGLVDDRINEIKKEAKQNGRHFLKIFLVMAFLTLIIGLIWGGLRLFDYVEDQIYLNHVRNSIEWQKENFPKLDALYEAEDYEGILSFYEKVENEGNYEDKRLNQWKHNRLVECYKQYLELSYYINGNITSETAPLAFYHAVGFYYREYALDFRGMIEEDVQKVDEEYRGIAVDFLHNYFKLTDEDLDEIYPELLLDEDSKIISHEKCQAYFEKMNQNENR